MWNCFRYRLNMKWTGPCIFLSKNNKQLHLKLLLCLPSVLQDSPSLIYQLRYVTYTFCCGSIRLCPGAFWSAPDDNAPLENQKVPDLIPICKCKLVWWYWAANGDCLQDGISRSGNKAEPTLRPLSCQLILCFSTEYSHRDYQLN